MAQSKSKGEDVIVDLKKYEDKLSKKIENFKENMSSEKDKVQKEAKDEVKKEKSRLSKEKEQELEKVRTKALDDAKKVISDYDNKMRKLDASFRTNSKKAENAVITALFEKK